MARLVFVLVMALSAGLVSLTSPPAATAITSVKASTPPADGKFQVQVGPEEAVFGPTSIMDSPYFAQRTATGLLGYLGNVTTYAFDAMAGRLSNGRVALASGPTGSFDACGAWLNSVYPVTATHWIGWYHAEAAGGSDNVCRDDGSTIWRIAYAESWDGGRTWVKPNYPKNVIISQSTSILAMNKVGTDAGNPRVIRVGNYFYALYQATGAGATYSGPGKGVNIARAPVTKLGAPGTWVKYFCTKNLLGQVTCQWNQPGVGGLSSSVTNLPAAARFVSWNTYLGRYVGLQASGRQGFSLRFSTGSDVLKWPSSTMIYPAVTTSGDTAVDDWTARNSTSKQLYGYPSIVGADGASPSSGRIFYIYYMKVFPGAGMDVRYLMRRKVTLAPTSATPYNRVALTTYRDAAGDLRSTTEQPKQMSYVARGSAGNLLSEAKTGWNAVFECYAGHGDAFLQVSKCADGHGVVRRVGFISPVRTAVAHVPIYRCYDPARRRHFAAATTWCSGKKLEFRLGYGLTRLT
ncbi:hypothetical protein [Nocardioides montaniterrae]